MTSSPVPPLIRSWPVPPKHTSLPAPALMVSSPSPPEMKSLPPLPLMTSCAPRPSIQSEPFVPFSVLLLELPRITFVPAGQHTGLSPSATVTWKLQDAAFPEASLTLQVSSVLPSGNVLPDGGAHTGVTLPQLSTAVAENVATAPLAFVQGTFTLAGHARTGGV